jgi:hypothetical protein
VVAEAVVAEAAAAMELASVPVSANHLAELQVEVVAKASDWVTDPVRGSAPDWATPLALHRHRRRRQPASRRWRQTVKG